MGKELITATQDLIFATEVHDSSETPTTEDINRLHNAIKSARLAIRAVNKVEVKVFIEGGCCVDVRVNLPDGDWDYEIIDRDIKDVETENDV